MPGPRLDIDTCDTLPMDMALEEIPAMKVSDWGDLPETQADGQVEGILQPRSLPVGPALAESSEAEEQAFPHKLDTPEALPKTSGVPKDGLACELPDAGQETLEQGVKSLCLIPTLSSPVTPPPKTRQVCDEEEDSLASVSPVEARLYRGIHGNHMVCTSL